jgi:hypothetical protein
MQIIKPKFATAGKQSIDCQIDHPQYGWIPFTASPQDTEAQGRTVYAQLIAGVHGPITEYVPPPPPSTEHLAREARAKRDAALSASDWTQLPDASPLLAPERSQAWAAYRQALRDVTRQSGFPNTVNWPASPSTPAT